MLIIKSVQALTLIWARELYTVFHKTLRLCDRYQHCWLCGNPFKVGDGMTVAHTLDRGNKLMYTQCYVAQTSEGQRKHLLTGEG